MKIINTVIMYIIVTLMISYASEDNTIQKGNIHSVPVSINLGKSINNKILETVYFENFESGMDGWTITGTWEVGQTNFALDKLQHINYISTNLHSHTYYNNLDAWLISPVIDIPEIRANNKSIQLCFREKFEIEDRFDRGLVNISVDEGNTWKTISVRYGYSDWRETVIPLNVKSTESIQIGFQFISDESETFGGWNIDDIRLEVYERDLLELSITNMNTQNFSYIYLNTSVNMDGVGVSDLDDGNFQVFENGTLQTENFNVSPPESGEGNRIADIVFVLDVTASMGDEIEAVRSNMLSFIDSLEVSNIDYGIGFIVFGDIYYSYNNRNLYYDSNQIIDIINNIQLGEHDIGSGEDVPENQLGAMAEASLFNYRPGAQNVQIMLTDAHAHESDYVTDWTVETVISNRLLPNEISVYPIFDIGNSAQFAQYVPIANATQDGHYYDIYDNFNEIINLIGNLIGNNYLISYRSSNPECDGVIREVEVVVNHQLMEASDTDEYSPCIAIELSEPDIPPSIEPGDSIQFGIGILDDTPPYTDDVEMWYNIMNEPEGEWGFIELVESEDSAGYWIGELPGEEIPEYGIGIEFYFIASDSLSSSFLPSIDPVSNPYSIGILPNEPPIILHTPIESITSGNSVLIEAIVEDTNDDVVSVVLKYRGQGDLFYNELIMVSEDDHIFIIEIPAETISEYGMEYFITAVDSYGLEGFSGTADHPYEVEVILQGEPQYNVLLTGWNQVTVPYVMDPCDPASVFEDFIDPFYDQNLSVSNIISWSESGSNYYIPDCISIGDGFWLKPQEDSTIVTLTGDPYPETEKTWSLTKQDGNYWYTGWHMIGNPFINMTDFTQAVLSDVDNIYYKWNPITHNYEFYPYGGRTQYIYPWEAVWVHAMSDGAQITLNSSTSLSKLDEVSFIPAWEGTLVATSNDETREIYFGVSESASDGFDGLPIDIPKVDFPMPPGVSAPVSLAFELPTNDEYSGKYARDIRRPDQPIYRWNFTVSKSDTDESLTLSLLDIEDIPEEYYILLYDEAGSDLLANLREEEYPFRFTDDQIDNDAPPFESEQYLSGFQLVVTTNLTTVIPDEFYLSQNYPNPFNSSTIISYGLPYESNVKIEIYNVLGQKVKTVMNKHLGAGNYTAVVELAEVSSGIYFCHFSTGSNNIITKMLYVK